jgi:cell volume regulation protein A
MAIGESGLGIEFENVDADPHARFCALVLIIAEGGLTTRWSVVRPVIAAPACSPPSASSSVPAWSAWCCTLVLGLSWQLAMLYGAVLSSTDAAAVFAVLRRLHIGRS